MALHASYVPAGCLHAELPRRPGHHQPLQAAAGDAQTHTHTLEIERERHTNVVRCLQLSTHCA